MAATYAQATSIQTLSENTYSADFPSEWCMGTVPQGGYVTSCILRVASIHFRTTLAKCNQPHTISLHLSFLRRSAVGRATFTVTSCKIGRTFSVVQISVAQTHQDKNATASTGDAAEAPRPVIVGYLTQANLASESGVSLPTYFALDPPPLPRGSTADLRANADPNWELQPQPSLSAWRNALRRVNTYIPRGGLRVVGAAATAGDEWICLASGERWTQESLGFVCDTFPLIPDAYGLRQDAEQLKKISDDSHLLHPDDQRIVNPRKFQSDSTSSSTPPSPSPSSSSSSSAFPPTLKVDLSKFWFPTLVLNMEIKKLLPPDGVEWLFVRVRPKQIRNGRLDLEIVVLDEEGDIVALSSHVALIVNGEMNLRGRL